MKKKHLIWIGSILTGLLLFGSLFVMGKVAYAVSTDSEVGVIIQGYIELAVELIKGFIQLAELILGL